MKSDSRHAGGFELNRDPAQITLADVYFAVEDETVFRMHKTDCQSHCPVAAQLGRIPVPTTIAGRRVHLHSSLAKTSISDVATSIV